MLQVYVLGSSVAVANRPSLHIPPEDEDVQGQRCGIQTVSRVSAHNSTSPMGCHRVRPPPAWLLDQVAGQLREKMHLQLFNFDMIRPTRTDAPGMCICNPVHCGNQVSCWLSPCVCLGSFPGNCDSPSYFGLLFSCWVNVLRRVATDWTTDLTVIAHVHCILSDAVVVAGITNLLVSALMGLHRQQCSSTAGKLL